MSRLLFLLKQKSRYGKFLPFAFFSAMVAFVGLRGADSDGVMDRQHFTDRLVPTAHADAPVSSAEDEAVTTTYGTYTTECGGASGGSDSDSDSASGGGSDGNSDCCFPAGVKILTPDGEKYIETIQIGDMVTSYDETAGTFTNSTVEKVLVHDAAAGDAHDFATHPLMRLEYEVSGTSKEVVITANHPVFSVATKEYQPVSEFAEGAKIMTDAGEGSIAKLEQIDEKEYFTNDPVVYNMSLTDGPHTYVADGLVVHNKDGGADCW